MHDDSPINPFSSLLIPENSDFYGLIIEECSFYRTEDEPIPRKHDVKICSLECQNTEKSKTLLKAEVTHPTEFPRTICSTLLCCFIYLNEHVEELPTVIAQLLQHRSQS